MESAFDKELEAFKSVCANECFAHVRDMYPAMGLCLRPLTASLPFARQAALLLDTLPLSQKVRGAYLARLLRFKMEPAIKAFWNQWLAEHKDLRADPASGLTFFHLDHDFAKGLCFDDAAVALGMRKGADLGKVMQLWEYGVA